MQNRESPTAIPISRVPPSEVMSDLLPRPFPRSSEGRPNSDIVVEIPSNPTNPLTNNPLNPINQQQFNERTLSLLDIESDSDRIANLGLDFLRQTQDNFFFTLVDRASMLTAQIESLDKKLQVLCALFATSAYVGVSSCILMGITKNGNVGEISTDDFKKIVLIPSGVIISSFVFAGFARRYSNFYARRDEELENPQLESLLPLTTIPNPTPTPTTTTTTTPTTTMTRTPTVVSAGLVLQDRDERSQSQS